MVLVELFAGMAAALAYNIDVGVAESKLVTARQLSSVLSAARLIDYSPSEATPAQIDLLVFRDPATEETFPTEVVAGSEVVADRVGTVEVSDASNYSVGDTALLSDGTNSDLVPVSSVVSNVIGLRGATRHSYASGDSVKRIASSHNVEISTVMRFATQGAVPRTYESSGRTTYRIQAGFGNVGQSSVLSLDRTARTITVTDATEYLVSEDIFIEDENLAANYQRSRITAKNDRTLTISDAIENWVARGSKVSRLVPASHGRTRVEALGQSNNLPRQQFALGFFPVVTSSVVVSIDEGSGYVNWTRVSNFLSSDSNDTHYVLEEGSDALSVRLGDDVNGKVPSQGANIRATYSQGSGEEGRVGANVVTAVDTVVQNAAGEVVAVECRNPFASIGGNDRESIDSIRDNAPASLRVLNRIVHVDDATVIAKRFEHATYGGIAQATSVEVEDERSITVYIWGADANGFASATTSELRDALFDELYSKSLSNYAVGIIDGSLVEIDITASIEVLSTFTQSGVEIQVRDAIDRLFQAKNYNPGDDFTVDNLYQAIKAVDGVSTVDITLPVRPGVTVGPIQMPTRGSVNLTFTGGA